MSGSPTPEYPRPRRAQRMDSAVLSIWHIMSLMGWIVAAVLVLSACGAARRVAADPDAGADSDADADSDSEKPCDLDADGDGFVAAECGGLDCNDDDPSIHPGAPEGVWEKER